MNHSLLQFPRRTIHLDFHTGPAIPDVGADFDADEFARTFKEAHVDSVTVFALCHHGHLYYNTDHPARHPSLSRELDLLEMQVEALHKANIRAPIYLTVLANELAARLHPEWIALTPELQQVIWSAYPAHAFTPGWKIMDMSSPYQDYLADILAEVLQRFAPVDGIFMDICWDQPSCSNWAIDGMLKQGYDPREEEDRNRYARRVSQQYMGRYRDMVEEAQRRHNPAGIWFNGRPKTVLPDEKKFYRHVEIEALPTGGWGYAFFPYVARFVRPLGLPALSHTARFFKSWGDDASLKPEMALKYECCQILSQGMSIGIGDMLKTRGALNKAAYELIGGVYGYIESCEPYVEGGKLLSQIAVVVHSELGDNPGLSGLGTMRALQQLRHQFDIVQTEAEFGGYELIVITETVRIDQALKARLQSYIQSGGAMIVCGPAALDADGGPVMEELGIDVQGPSPYTHTFLNAMESVADGLPDMGYVMYEPGFRMLPGPGAEALVRVGEPFFQRDYDRFSGHYYTPEARLSDYAAAVRSGRIITFSVPILEAYGKHAVLYYRQLLGNCIDLLLPEPLIRDKGPSSLETTVVRTGEATVVHLMSFAPMRRADDLDIVEDALPLVNMPIAVRSGSRPSRVFLAPGERDLPFEYRDGYVYTEATVPDGHALLVISDS